MAHPNHPISPGYTTNQNPDVDLTTPIRPAGLDQTLRVDLHTLRTAPPADYIPPHAVDVTPLRRTRRPQHPQPRHRDLIDVAWWRMAVGLATTHAVAFLLGAAVAAAAFTDWSS